MTDAFDQEWAESGYADDELYDFAETDLYDTNCDIGATTATGFRQDDDPGPKPQWEHIDTGAGVDTWGRPAPRALHPATDSIRIPQIPSPNTLYVVRSVFQQFDVDFVIDASKPVVRIFGVNDSGGSCISATFLRVTSREQCVCLRARI